VYVIFCSYHSVCVILLMSYSVFICSCELCDSVHMVGFLSDSSSCLYVVF